MNNNKPKGRDLLNNNIKAKEVICIDHNNNNLGIVTLSKALSIAYENGMDLLQIAPPNNGNGPVCRVVNYGKYKFESSKKQKLQAKKQRESVIKTKEMQFRPTTGVSDLEIKAQKVSLFLEEGCKVKISVTMTGRELSHADLAYDQFDRFMDLLNNVMIISEPLLSGKHLTAVITKSTKKSEKVQ